MLKKFSVENFKNFSHEIVFDLGNIRNYEFNQECIDLNIVRMAQIYGENASGKSNIGLAIFDLVSHLTENRTFEDSYSNYSNAFSNETLTKFNFDFTFSDINISYSYGKKDHDNLVYETLKIDEEIVIMNDRSDLVSVPFVQLKGAEQLSFDGLKSHDISIIKYVARNTVLDITDYKVQAFIEFMTFVDKMLYFRPVKDNRYQGLPARAKNISSYIIDTGKLDDFESFLHAAGIDCKLDQDEDAGRKIIVFDFGETKINFTEIASTGTMALFLLYFWLVRLEEERNPSLVFIDEFDAYYHHKLSAFVIARLKTMKWLQIIVTTHNTTLMGNDILRPDCNFILSKNKIRPIFEVTDKELREAHNIEKMYRAGAFNDDK